MKAHLGLARVTGEQVYLQFPLKESHCESLLFPRPDSDRD
jgi:hypothetical protein